MKKKKKNLKAKCPFSFGFWILIYWLYIIQSIWLATSVPSLALHCNFQSLVLDYKFAFPIKRPNWPNCPFLTPQYKICFFFFFLNKYYFRAVLTPIHSQWELTVRLSTKHSVIVTCGLSNGFIYSMDVWINKIIHNFNVKKNCHAVIYFGIKVSMISIK